MTEAALQALFEQGRLWRGQSGALPRSALPTGFAALDAALPGGGWPAAALSEILLPADGVGELQLLWPLLARLSMQGGRIVLVAPPYIPFAPAWATAGIALPQLQVVQTGDDRNALWVTEQCLRSAACAAVLCWPRQADSRSLRRLQLAAETGQCQGFAMRPAEVAAQPSMATLRILIEVDPARWRVLKCRGGNPPTRAVPLRSIMPSRAAHAPSPSAARSALRAASLPSKADGGEGEKRTRASTLSRRPSPPSRATLIAAEAQQNHVVIPGPLPALSAMEPGIALCGTWLDKLAASCGSPFGPSAPPMFAPASCLRSRVLPANGAGSPGMTRIGRTGGREGDKPKADGGEWDASLAARAS